MSAAIIPKSELRISHNIIVGYGEVPAIYVHGVLGWGLPGGLITFSEEEAIGKASELDRAIRARMTDINYIASQLLKNTG